MLLRSFPWACRKRLLGFVEDAKNNDKTKCLDGCRTRQDGSSTCRSRSRFIALQFALVKWHDLGVSMASRSHPGRVSRRAPTPLPGPQTIRFHCSWRLSESPRDSPNKPNDASEKAKIRRMRQMHNMRKMGRPTASRNQPGPVY